MAEPNEFVPAVRMESMFGSTGSMYGGMKIRPAFASCSWMSLLICRFASVDGSEMNATRKGLPNVVLPERADRHAVARRTDIRFTPRCGSVGRARAIA